MLALTFLRLVAFFVMKHKLILVQKWTLIFSEYREFLEERKRQQGDRQGDPPAKELDRILSLLELDIEFIGYQQKLEIIRFTRREQGFGKVNSRVYHLSKCVEMLAIDFEFRYHIFHLGISIIQIVYQFNFFFSLLLLDIIRHYEPLKNVIKSITMHSRDLILTAIL